jgi:hypothetical protein
VHVRPPLEAHQQAAELVQPGEAALDRPAHAPQARAVGRLAAGDLGPDAALAKLAAMGVVVIAAVGHQDAGPAAGPPDPAGDGRHGIHQRDQLGDVVAVAAGQADRERDARGVDEEVVLGAGPAAVDRARARLGAPFFACTWLESTIAREKSIRSAVRSRVSSSR